MISLKKTASRITIVFIICIIIIPIGIEEANNIINLHNNLKHFEKEKELRLSIFKITHEIKNPLAVIKGYLDMFDVDDKDKSNRYLSIMGNELTRTLNLLNDFLEFTKIKIYKKTLNVNFYQSKDWYVGKNKMKDWKAAVRTWENKSRQENKQQESESDADLDKYRMLVNQF